MNNEFTVVFKTTLTLPSYNLYTYSADVLPSTLGSFNCTEQFFSALICKTIVFFVLLLFHFIFITFCCTAE